MQEEDRVWFRGRGDGLAVVDLAVGCVGVGLLDCNSSGHFDDGGEVGRAM